MNATLTAEQLDALRASPELRATWIREGYAKDAADADRENALALFSDTYKELNGFRPRWVGQHTFEQLAELYYETLAQLERQLLEESHAEEAQRKAEQVARQPHAWTFAELANLQSHAN